MSGCLSKSWNCTSCVLSRCVFGEHENGAWGCAPTELDFVGEGEWTSVLSFGNVDLCPPARRADADATVAFFSLGGVPWYTYVTVILGVISSLVGIGVGVWKTRNWWLGKLRDLDRWLGRLYVERRERRERTLTARRESFIARYAPRDGIYRGRRASQNQATRAQSTPPSAPANAPPPQRSSSAQPTLPGIANPLYRLAPLPEEEELFHDAPLAPAVPPPTPTPPRRQDVVPPLPLRQDVSTQEETPRRSGRTRKEPERFDPSRRK